MWRGVLWTVLVWGWPTSAHAHPFQDGLAGHRIRLTVRADQVEAEVLIEEPIPWVLRDLRTFLGDIEEPGPADQERYTRRRLTEFQEGLQLFVDGKRTEWEAVPVSGKNGVGDRQFVVYTLHLRAPLDPEQADQAVHVLDVNHADLRVARYFELWGAWDTDLRGCSLWADRSSDISGKWAVGNDTAEVRLTRRLAGPLDAYWARLGQQWRSGSTEPVRVGADGIAGPVARTSAIAVLVGLFGLAGAALGLLRAWKRRRARHL